MGERKGFETYISPDFDPALVERKKSKKKSGNTKIDVRLAIPFSISCTSCPEFMYKARKFNAKKETVVGETYLGLKIFRFYIKCTGCSGHITFKTDPENGSYKCEEGATRNFELFLESKAAAVTEEAQLEEVALDPMRALESKTATNQAELDAIDSIEAERARRSRFDKLGTAPAAILAALDRQRPGIDTAYSTTTTTTGGGAGIGGVGLGGSSSSAGGDQAASFLNEHGLSAADEAELASATFAAARHKGRRHKRRRGAGPADSDSGSDSGSGSDNSGYGGGGGGGSGSGASAVGAMAPAVVTLLKKRRRDKDAPAPVPAAVAALAGLAAYGSDSDSD